MYKEDSILGVALVKEACPLCGYEEDGPIILNKILNKSQAKKVEEMNGKTIGYMNKPCKECQDIMNQAFLLIGIVKAKTDDFKNPYRSGNKWGIKKEAAIKIFGEEYCKKGAGFIDVIDADQIGLPDANINA